MKCRVLMVLGLVLLVVLSGCETFRGFGRDMQRAGRAIERTVEP